VPLHQTGVLLRLCTRQWQACVSLVQILLHFVAFIHRDGHLYELDGRKFDAINHGPTSPETLLMDSCAVVKKLMEATDNIRFTLMALAPAE
jgi:hypothetical protein